MSKQKHVFIDVKGETGSISINGITPQMLKKMYLEDDVTVVVYQSAFEEAIKKDAQKAKLLIKYWGESMFYDSYMKVALEANKPDIVRLLLEKEVDINKESLARRIIAHCAIAYEKKPWLDILHDYQNRITLNAVDDQDKQDLLRDVALGQDIPRYKLLDILLNVKDAPIVTDGLLKMCLEKWCYTGGTGDSERLLERKYKEAKFNLLYDYFCRNPIGWNVFKHAAPIVYSASLLTALNTFSWKYALPIGILTGFTCGKGIAFIESANAEYRDNGRVHKIDIKEFEVFCKLSAACAIIMVVDSYLSAKPYFSLASKCMGLAAMSAVYLKSYVQDPVMVDNI